MKNININKIVIFASAIILLAFIIILGPLDYFTHGYYCDEIDFEMMSNDLQEPIDLAKGDCEMKFSPVKNHFAGFEINLINQPKENSGELLLTIKNKKGKEIDNIVVDLSKVKATKWYRTYVNEKLSKGEEYTLVFSAEKCKTIPYLQTVDSDCLSEETVTGNILLGYAYEQSTFTLDNKILISMFVIALWGFICAGNINDKNNKRMIIYSSTFVMVTAILAWNYMYNSMDNENYQFEDFQTDSEALVTSVITAEHNGNWFEEKESGYGLGSYNSYFTDYTDDYWINGYSRSESAILVPSNKYSREYAMIGNYISFENGDMYQIVDIIDDGEKITIYLNSGRILNPIKYGKLENAQYYDYNMNFIAPLSNGKLSPYTSQFGLQGKIFRHLVRYMDYENAIQNLHLVCCIFTSAVFVLICMLIYKKYNALMSMIFLITFWLSPWIVNYGRNLYWVEFTWFAPMAIGLFCSLRINDKKSRILCYVLTFISITGKCLCGYEYLSVVMMGLITFLFADLVVALVKKDNSSVILIFRTIFILGIIALLGFILAICIHASVRGSGQIFNGIKIIIEQDVLRRTNGADLNMFGTVLWESFNASVWETVCLYFHFNTEIITGISGNIFPILIISPLCIFVYEYKNKELNVELLGLYIISFISSISWFVLAKSHSYIHTHINFVLWYFGFVQICFYIILNKLIEKYKLMKNVKIKD